MSNKHRLDRIEAQFASLPVNGHFLVSRLERMTAAGVGEAIRNLSDDELKAIIQVSPEESGPDVGQLTDEQLQAIINGDSVSLE
jgi:hypothetical protein